MCSNSATAIPSERTPPPISKPLPLSLAITSLDFDSRGFLLNTMLTHIPDLGFKIDAVENEEFKSNYGEIISGLLKKVNQ